MSKLRAGGNYALSEELKCFLCATINSAMSSRADIPHRSAMEIPMLISALPERRIL